MQHLDPYYILDEPGRHLSKVSLLYHAAEKLLRGRFKICAFAVQNKVDERLI